MELKLVSADFVQCPEQGSSGKYKSLKIYLTYAALSFPAIQKHCNSQARKDDEGEILHVKLTVHNPPLRKHIVQMSVTMACSAMVTTALAVTQVASSNSPEISPAHMNDTTKAKNGYRAIQLDFSSLKNASTTTSLILPLPEGGETEFTLWDSGTFPPELAQRYPNIRSMKGVDAQGRQVRLDMSEGGVRAIVFDQDGIWLVQPAKKGNGSSVRSNDYISFREKTTPARMISSDQQHKQRELTSKAILVAQSASNNNETPSKNDNSHRDYRIAIATTSAYSKHFGGTVSSSLASVVEALNRVNAVFERDVGIHLTLVKDNDKIIFTDAATDPYIVPDIKSPDWDFDFTKKKNQKVVTQLIGKDNFDIGHLFELSAGGSVEDDSACQDEIKANANSGFRIPTSNGDSIPDREFFKVVAHEIGHQFGASHTMNGCDRDETEAKNAFEPGSGSTLMSYVNECPIWDGSKTRNNNLHNLQNTADTYFHAKNIEQVRKFIAGPGAKCGIKRNTPNTPPVFVTPHDNTTLYIPAQTPFSLTGYARSANPHAQLTYTWEQIDLGPLQKKNDVLSDKGQGPIFRSYPPTSDGTRIFPKLEAILGEEKISLGEVYPATTRELNFRLTVRDNLAEQVSTAYIDKKIHVLNTGHAFAITHPTNITRWKQNDKQPVSWNVAGTSQPPISCQNVRIDLSVDGGHTYLAQPLLASTPNIGRAQVDLPALDQDTSKARIRISCNSNLFFALSPSNFTILK